MMYKTYKDLKKYNKFLLYSTKSGLKSEVAGSHLSWLWWILEPTMFMLIYWYIFSIIFQKKITYFPLYAFLGLSMWNFFNKSLMISVKIIKVNTAIVSKVYVPKYILVLIQMLQQGFKMIVSFSVIVVLMIIYRVPISFNIIFIIPILITLFLFTLGICCIFAHFGVFVEDLSNFLNIAMRFVFYLSGVFYEIIPRTGKGVLKGMYATVLAKCNPMAFLMTSCRQALIYSERPEISVLAIWLVISIFLSVIGIKLIYRYENSYVKVI